MVGESGSGKSVTAHSVMGLLPKGQLDPVAGRILLEGEDLLAASDKRLRDLRCSRMSMIFQEPMTALNPVMTCGDQIDEVLRTHTEVENADHDPFHTNDIDEFFGEGEGLFQKGDLALSFRSLNLLLVVRPATRRIVWYAYGLTSRQHDPDFVSADAMLVYDNNFHNPGSRIVRLEATAGTGSETRFGARREVLVDRFAGSVFQQLTEGYQFFAGDRHSLIFSANHYHVGVDTRDARVFLVLRHRWRDEAFLNLEIERLLTPAEFDAIAGARCRG